MKRSGEAKASPYLFWVFEAKDVMPSRCSPQLEKLEQSVLPLAYCGTRLHRTTGAGLSRFMLVELQAKALNVVIRGSTFRFCEQGLPEKVQKTKGKLLYKMPYMDF